MKQFGLYLLICTLLLPLSRPLQVYLSYKLQQELIAEEFCVNRNIPDEFPMCQGKCYYKEQLNNWAEDAEEQEEQGLDSKKELQINFLYEELRPATARWSNALISIPFILEPAPFPAYCFSENPGPGLSVFHPPLLG